MQKRGNTREPKMGVLDNEGVTGKIRKISFCQQYRAGARRAQQAFVFAIVYVGDMPRASSVERCDAFDLRFTRATQSPSELLGEICKGGRHADYFFPSFFRTLSVRSTRLLA